MLPLLHSVSKIGNKADTERVFSYRRLCVPSTELRYIKSADKMWKKKMIWRWK